jgi:hypothetical protein
VQSIKNIFLVKTFISTFFVMEAMQSLTVGEKKDFENDFDMQNLTEELNDVVEKGLIEDPDLDTCSITAVNGDSDNEVEPPCIYQGTSEDYALFHLKQKEQFEIMWQSLAFGMFKKKMEEEGPWQGWDSMSFEEKDIDIECILYTGQSLTSGSNTMLDEFICFLYVVSQMTHDIDLSLLKIYQDEFCKDN